MTHTNYKIIRQYNKNSIEEFKLRLSYEAWENIFNDESNYVDNLFNNFLDIYLQIFCHCFPKNRCYEKTSRNTWITKGIKISCMRKRELYLLTREHENSTLRQYYQLYCKILTTVILEAKRHSYNESIIN